MSWMQVVFLVVLFATAGFEGCRIGLNLILIGRPYPIRRIGRLHDPRRVVGVDADYLLLDGNQRVPLPGLMSFQSRYPRVWEKFVKRGVDVSPDGRVHGLVRIHHWCGNDPVRLEIARVDLAEALAYLRQGGLHWEFCQEDASQDVCHDYAGRFSSTGWMVEEYQDFLEWRLRPSEKSLPDGSRH